MGKKEHYAGQKQIKDTWGNLKTLSVIDHDKKQVISSSSLSQNEKEELMSSLREYRNELISRILSTPPSLCPTIFHDFTTRGDKISWNESMIGDPGVPLQKLQDISNMLDNIKELI